MERPDVYMPTKGGLTLPTPVRSIKDGKAVAVRVSVEMTFTLKYPPSEGRRHGNSWLPRLAAG
jgi:hypothetical protein